MLPFDDVTKLSRNPKDNWWLVEKATQLAHSPEASRRHLPGYSPEKCKEN